MLILKVSTSLILSLLPIAIFIRDWKFHDKRTKLHHKITRCILVFWFVGSIAAVGLVWNETYLSSELNNKVDELVDGKNKLLNKIEVYQKDLDEKQKIIEQLEENLENAAKRIGPLEQAENMKKLGDEAIIGKRESYAKLKELSQGFGPKVTKPRAELARVHQHWNEMTRLKGIVLPPKKLADGKILNESEYSTQQLIEVLLLDTYSLHRARSAQLLATKRERYAAQALILSAFGDEDLEVVKESSIAFAKLLGCKCPDFFDHYCLLSCWYDNSQRFVSKAPYNFQIIPWSKFADRITIRMGDDPKSPINNQRYLCLDLANKLVFSEIGRIETNKKVR